MTSTSPHLTLEDALDEHALLSDIEDGVTVLHIEDDSSFADLVSTFLEREREFFDIHTETNPVEGVELAKEGEADCIVCDYDMPEMDGLDVLEAIRSDIPELPFILFTGKGSEEIASEAISAGVTEYLQKRGGTEQYEVLANRIEQAVARRRAERQVTRGFRAIETAHDGISLLDPDGKFMYVNEAYAEIVGYERTELVGQHWDILYPEKEEKQVHEEILPGARDEEWVGETDYIRKDGKAITVDHRLVYTKEDTLVCAISATDDIETVRDELSLKEHSMDEAPIGITITNPTRPDNPIIYANSGFTELTGYAREEVLGRNCRFLQGDRTQPGPITELDRAIDAEEPVSVELRNYRQDGELFWNRVTVAPLTDEDGDVEYFVGFQEDVTARRGLLEEFGALADVLSHDMQNPLQTVRGRVRLALDTGDVDHVEEALPSLDRMEQLVDDVANALESGTIVGEHHPIDLEELVETTWESLDRHGETGSLKIDDAPMVHGNPEAVRRMFDNLLGNSLEHGEAPINIRVGASDDGIFLEDNGPGIAEPNREQVFEQGFSTKSHNGGTGMGMASVRQIVLAHDWRIDITESDELGGVRFEIQTRQ
ncbi:PAS domain-containing protein [Natronorubrum sp. JWXQ-INN-674]|uniref:PAS domain S-box protein n=2 Tax=Natrialbaceae TaxID=1644061 RepID=A0A4S3TGW8_9EURY|nr:MULTISPECIES: PAS domain-containing protein [Natrialbaceae]MXV61624.1 PAS domain-containing protein [Natronorubrum halalkaliphilum]THE63126.1 PAS domain S-box protein [Salinadaptatus halalkaliphilus]